MEKNQEMNWRARGCRRLVLLLLTAAALFCGFPAPAPAAEGPQQVTLDAERVSYDDEAGKAEAEGDAVLVYEGATIRADRIDYDAVSQKVRASADPGNSVILEGQGYTVTGDELEYDLNTRDGVLRGVNSELPVGNGTLYVTGGSIRYMPYEEALAQGLVSEVEAGQPYTGLAEDVTATTCALDHPHYRIESKHLIFVPGQRLIAKKPRLYLGDTFIFTYPMDYIVRIDRKAQKYNFMPYIEDNEEKGTGAGFSGGFEWDTGSLGLGAAYWGDTGIEWMVEAEQRIGDGFSVEGGVEYTWSEAWDEKQYSPYAALRYSRNGWEALLHGTWNEYVEIQKNANYEYRGRLDRKPELIVRTPWFNDPAWRLSWVSFEAAAGSYWERTPDLNLDTIDRYGLKMFSYTEYPIGNAATFFSNASYETLFYDHDEADQQTMQSVLGFRYNLGALEMASGYERRYAWGYSPMSWDSNSEIEMIHQKIRFPLGKEVYLSLLGSYDLDTDDIYEINYALQWITDCMKWELRYRDDHTSGSNSSIGLSLSILAYPNTPLSFGQSEPEDPFERPDLPQ